MKNYALLLLVCWTFNSVAQTQQEEDRHEIRTLYFKVTELAKADLSCSQNEDCAVVPVGHKACGGPNLYVIASYKNVRINDLLEAALLSKEKEQNYNLRYGVMSDCSILRPPFASCFQGLCQNHHDH